MCSQIIIHLNNAATFYKYIVHTQQTQGLDNNVFKCSLKWNIWMNTCSHFKPTAAEGHRERKVWNINTPKEKQDLQYSTFWIISATAVVAQPIHEQKADGRLVNSTELV